LMTKTQDNRVQRNIDIRAKKDNLGWRNKWPNDKVQRKDETELQIAALIKGMATEDERWLKKTDELIISAISLRKK